MAVRSCRLNDGQTRLGPAIFSAGSANGQCIYFRKSAKWRNARQDGVHDLPRVQGKDTAAIITRMTYTHSNRVSRNSLGAQKEHDAMPKSANE